MGYGWSDADWQFAATPGVSTNHSGGGALVGGQIGYNIQMRQYVFGVEADLSSAGIDGSTACPGAGFNCGHSFNWMASVRGRAGIAVNNNRTLLYGTAGVAWADVDYAAKDVVTGATFGTGFSNTHVGWVAGAGIEHMLTQNLTARVEYLYYGFDFGNGACRRARRRPRRPRSQQPDGALRPELQVLIQPWFDRLTMVLEDLATIGCRGERQTPARPICELC